MLKGVASRTLAGQVGLSVSSRGGKDADKTGTDRPEMGLKDEIVPGRDRQQLSLEDELRSVKAELKSLKGRLVADPQKPDPDRPGPNKPAPRSGASWFDRDGFLGYNRYDSDAVSALKALASVVIGVPLLVGSIAAVVCLAMQVPVAGLALVCIGGYAFSHAGGI